MNSTPLRGDDVRIRNENIVLNLIFQTGTISQSMVVQRTGLKAPTVFRIFAKLEEEGFIRQGSTETVPRKAAPQDRKGRRPNMYSVVPTSRYAIGVDFSSISGSVIAVDFTNRVIYSDTTEFGTSPERQEILQTIEQMIHNALKSASIPPGSVLGIGIASPGVVDTVTGTVLEYGRIKGLCGFSLRDYFESRFSVPVFVHNNASVIASGAYHYGSARNEKSLLAILVRSGVGGALVNHGQVFLNGTVTTLEIGRTAVTCFPPDKPAGATPAESMTLESIVAEQPMLEHLTRAFGYESWGAAQASATETQVAGVLTEARTALATAVRNLYHIFHPEAILLISRFPLIATVLGDAARKALPELRVISMVYDPVQACYGATDIVFQHFFGLTSQSQTIPESRAIRRNDS